jgi:hypothetical protein
VVRGSEQRSLRHPQYSTPRHDVDIDEALYGPSTVMLMDLSRDRFRNIGFDTSHLQNSAWWAATERPARSRMLPTLMGGISRSFGQRRRMTSAFRLARRVAALLSSTVFRAACASERHDRHGALRGQPGGRGRGREPLSMATKVKTASVTLICASPSRDRRQASTWNFIDVRPVETRSA